MSAIVISRFDEKDLPELKEIFFESSARKEFKDEDEKEKFYRKYLGLYLEISPELALVAKSDKVLGYILGQENSDGKVRVLQPHLDVFKDLFDCFPAHLHINLHRDSRGLGIGSKLLIEFENLLINKGIKGVHLMTSPSSRNSSFYRRSGYHFEETRDYAGNGILFMGKSLK
jgi:ribosomal protein S18 acetylase RimI-like enzyme